MPYDFANTILRSIDLQDQLNVKKQEMKTEEMHYNTQMAVQNRQFAFNVAKDTETRAYQQQQLVKDYFKSNSPIANLDPKVKALVQPDANGLASNEQISHAL